MEEKKVLLDIESNLSQYEKEVVKSAQAVKELQEELKRLKKEDGDNVQQIEETKRQLRDAQKEYRESTKSVDTLAKANKAGAGSYAELQAQVSIAEKALKTQTGLIERNADGTIKLTDAYVKASKDVEQARGAINKFNEGIHNGTTSVGLYEEKMKNALSGLNVFGVNVGQVAGTFSNALPAGVGASSKALGIFRLALIATGIGAFVVLLGSLISYFKQSADGQNKLSEIMARFGGIVDAIKDAFAGFGELMVNAFKNPKQAVIDLWDAIKENMINRFTGMVDLVVSGWTVISKGAEGVALAVAGIFSEEKRKQAKEAFGEMTKGLKDMGLAAVQVVTGVENFGQKLLDFGKKVDERGQANQRLQERENALRMKQIKDLTTLAKLDADIAEARRIAADETGSLSGMIEAQERAMALVEQKMNLQVARAQEALSIQRSRNALGKTNIEDLEKEAQLEADLILLNKTKDDQMREMVGRYGALIGRVAAEEKAVADAIEKERQARMGVLEEIRKAGLTDIERIEEELQAKLALHEWSEAEMLTITKFYRDQIAEIEREQREKTREAEEREKAEREARAKELAEKEIAYRKQVVDDTISGAAQLVGALSKFADKNSALHKALAVSEAIINTYVGVTKALASYPPPASYIMAAVTLANGMLAVRNILNTDKGTKSVSTSMAKSAPSVDGAFVAGRANEAIARGENNMTNVGATTTRLNDSRNNKELIEAIKNMPAPVVAVETIERKSAEKRNVEVKAMY